MNETQVPQTELCQVADLTYEDLLPRAQELVDNLWPSRAAAARDLGYDTLTGQHYFRCAISGDAKSRPVLERVVTQSFARILFLNSLFENIPEHYMPRPGGGHRYLHDRQLLVPRQEVAEAQKTASPLP